MRIHNILAIIALASFFFSWPVWAQVVFNEIMYDLPGTDTGREWVEIANTGASEVTVATSTWKFFEANTNHILSLFQGNVSIPAGGFAIIADDPNKFLLDWPQFTGTIFGSAFSLSNTGEPLALKSGTTTVVDQVTYVSTTGASGDGNSLQKVNGIWKTLPPTPGLVNPDPAYSSATSSNQNQNPSATTTDNSATDNNSSAGNTTGASGGNTSNWSVEPQIISRIVGPGTAIAGADIVLKGEAVGLDKKPLDNPRYLWNFGDGATKEGESVMHAYNFPGDYVVIFDASSGKWSGTSRLKIKVVPADLVIGEVVNGLDGKVELVNNSNQELDLSWWRIRNGSQFFTIPKNTKILPSGRLPLASAVMGFAVDDSSVSLLYPNGSLAYKFEKVVAGETSPVITTAPENKAPASNIAVVALPPEAPEEPVGPTVKEAPKFSAPSKIAAQTASVALAADTSNETPATDGTAASAKAYSSLWLYGLGGIIILGLGFALYPKVAATAPQKNLADEYKIIED